MSSRMSMPVPPGGELVCAAGQMPKIKVIGGQIFAECCSPPQTTTISKLGKYTPEFKRWALSVIKEDKSYVLHDLRYIDLEDQRILDKGVYRYHDEVGRVIIVLFALPEIGATGGTTPLAGAR